MSESTILGKTIGRVERRLRIQQILESFSFAAYIALIPCFIFFFTYRMDWISEQVLIAGFAGAAAVMGLGILWGSLRRIAAFKVAWTIDQNAKLSDRLSSAHHFLSHRSPSPFIEALVQDAERHAMQIDLRRLFKFSFPALMLPALAVLASIIIVHLLHFLPAPKLPKIKPPLRAPLIGALDTALAREALEKLEKKAKALDEPRARKIHKALASLWKDIESGKFSKKQIFKKISAFQRKFFKGKEGQFRDLKEAKRGFSNAGKILAKNKLTRKLGQALKTGNLKWARKALQELIRKLNQRELSRRQQKKLRRTLEKASRPFRRALNNLKRQMERLKRQLKKRKLDKLTRQRKRRELERLSRTLDKLKQMLPNQLMRQLQKAAQKLKKYAQQDAGQSLKKIAEQLKRLMKKMSRRSLMGGLKRQLEKMKDLLRQGRRKGRLAKLRDFFKRAFGEKRCRSLLRLSRRGGKGGSPRPGRNKGRQLERLSRKGRGEKGGKGGKAGKKWGKGSDFRLGQETKLLSKREMKRLTGKHGPGNTISKVILTAAKRGFTGVGFKRVLAKYRKVWESALEHNKAIPHGYRRIVQKYFETLRIQE